MRPSPRVVASCSIGERRARRLAEIVKGRRFSSLDELRSVGMAHGFTPEGARHALGIAVDHGWVVEDPHGVQVVVPNAVRS